MTRYLVERYLSIADAACLREETLRLDSCVGPRARLLGTVYAAEDETCFHLFDAPSASEVRQIGADAGVQMDRLVDVVTICERLPEPA